MIVLARHHIAVCQPIHGYAIEALMMLQGVSVMVQSFAGGTHRLPDYNHLQPTALFMILKP